jgi:DinB superfamily
VTPVRDPLRAHVLELLHGGEAHATFEDAVADIPPALLGVAPPGAPHTPWQLVEHIRITQRDILDFSTNDDGHHQPREWPAGYWPPDPAPANTRAWTKTVTAILDDRAAMERLVSDLTRDLLAPFPWGSGQTLLREALLVADHTSYHVGQLVIVRRILGAWSD